MNIGSDVNFFKGNGVLNAEKETTEQHVGVLGVGLDLKGAHHDVNKTRFELTEGDDSVKEENFEIIEAEFRHKKYFRIQTYRKNSK